MQSQPNAQENPSSYLEEDSGSTAAWRVASVRALEAYRLQVIFRDGVEGQVDLKGLIESRDAGVFADLANPELFAQAYVLGGAVTWPNGVDLAPDAMYDAIARDGKWVLQ